jgi:MFS-type transporter involved in bile tolerance (Atg22 family)
MCAMYENIRLIGGGIESVVILGAMAVGVFAERHGNDSRAHQAMIAFFVALMMTPLLIAFDPHTSDVTRVACTSVAILLAFALGRCTLRTPLS